MGQYSLVFSDTNKTEKRVLRGTSGTTGNLQFKIIDETGAAFNFTGMTTVGKIYIGVENTLLVNGTNVTSTTAASGLATYNIAWADFADNTEVGRFLVELYFADNASPTKAISAGQAVLIVEPTIID